MANEEDVNARQQETIIRAFDKLQLCFTVFPQLKHYYRYGELRDCTKERLHFAHILSIKTKSKKEQVTTTTILSLETLLIRPIDRNKFWMKLR